MKDRVRIKKSYGNIFEDLAVAHPDRTLVRAQVMCRTAEIIRKLDLTQKEASRLLGIPQSKVSCLLNGKLHMFSLDHLLQLLNTLGKNVEIVISPRSKNQSKTFCRVV